MTACTFCEERGRYYLSAYKTSLCLDHLTMFYLSLSLDWTD